MSTKLIAADNAVPNRCTIQVLLVDDSPVMLSTLSQILTKQGLPILLGTATDGWLALRSALGSRPDLVLLDLNLPCLDGTEVTRYLKLLPNPPVVFMVTSDDSTNAKSLSKAAGADAFIVKASDLEAQIRSNLREWFTEPRGSDKAGNSPPRP